MKLTFGVSGADGFFWPHLVYPLDYFRSVVCALSDILFTLRENLYRLNVFPLHA